MAIFSSPKKQAKSVGKALRRVLPSRRTVVNYRESLEKVAEYAKTEWGTNLRDLTPEQAIEYLEQRAGEVRQSTLDQERQAIQAMFVHVTDQLEPGETLTVVKAEMPTVLESRIYTFEQVAYIASHQAEPNGLATQIAYAAGLRAHELLTLRPIEEQPPDPRPALDTKFLGRPGERYTVAGKGGLVREVSIPHHLAGQLEARRLDRSRLVIDRGVLYQQHYDIGGGNKWSSSFTTASKRNLGWSRGAHGLRHSYAQERMRELAVHATWDKRLETVSQELGHFRPDITLTYLR